MQHANRLYISDRPYNGETLWVDDPERLKAGLAAIEHADVRAAVETFAADGFYIVRNAIPPDLCDRAISDYYEWIKANVGEENFARADGRNKRLQNLHLRSKTLQDVFTKSKEVLFYQDLFFGYRASIYTSLFFQYGTEQAIHRDVPVFRTAPENFYFGVWFAFEDATETNGRLRVVRGGHRVLDIDQYEIAERYSNDVESISPTDYRLWDIYQAAVLTTCEQRGLFVEEVSLNKGDALIWHPLLPHGGSQIRDASRTRHSIVFHTVPEGVPVYKADVFFNRRRRDETDLSPFSYKLFDGRLAADRGEPVFGGV